MNGEENTINMYRPVSYYKLTKMSKEVQVRYIQGLRDTYNASSAMLAECLGIAKPTVRKYLISLGLNQDRSAKRATRDQRDAWDRFCALEDNALEPKPEQTQEAAPALKSEPAPKLPVVHLDDDVTMDFVRYQVNGTAYAACKLFIAMIGAGTKGTFYISFEPDAEGGEDDE